MDSLKEAGFVVFPRLSCNVTPGWTSLEILSQTDAGCLVLSQLVLYCSAAHRNKFNVSF